MNHIILGSVNGGFTEDLFDNDKFVVSNIENLTWGSNNLALTENPYKSGDTIQNMHGLARDITIEIKPLKDKGDFSAALTELSWLVGDTVYLIWKDQTFEGLTSDWTINGVVSSIEADRFSDDVRATLIIHCEDPYWQGSKITASSNGGRVPSVTLYGTAPTDYRVTVNNVTVPKTPVATPLSGYSPDAYLEISIGNFNGWKFSTSGANNLTGKLIVNSGVKPPVVTLSGTTRYDIVSSPLKALVPRLLKKMTVAYCHPDYLDGTTIFTYYDFTVEYTPRYY